MGCDIYYFNLLWGGVDIIVLQISKLRIREVKQILQDHTGGLQQNLDKLTYATWKSTTFLLHCAVCFSTLVIFIKNKEKIPYYIQK